MLKKSVREAFMAWCVIMATVSFAGVKTYDLPAEVKSTAYTVTVNGQNADVCHFLNHSSSYYTASVHVVNFDFTGTATVVVRSNIRKFAKSDIFPSRLGITATRSNNDSVLTFTMDHPLQVTINDTTAKEKLFIFGNPPEVNPPKAGDPNVIYRGPGVYTENFDLTSGQTLYLHGGAVVTGSINVWGAKNVKVLGRGYIRQQRADMTDDHDNGPPHVKNEHPLTTDNVDGMLFDGITMGTGNRVWTIQQWNTSNAKYENFKIVTYCMPYNGDGFDFSGSCKHDTITDCFFYGTDDALANYGSNAVSPTVNEVDSVIVSNFTSIKPPGAGNFFRIGWTGVGMQVNGWKLQNCSSTGPGWVFYHEAQNNEALGFRNCTIEDLDVEAWLGTLNDIIAVVPTGSMANLSFRNVSYINNNGKGNWSNCAQFSNIKFENFVRNNVQETSASAAGFTGTNVSQLVWSNSVFPSVPLMKWPFNHNDSVSAPATLSWTRSKNATSYRCQVSETRDFANTVYDNQGITDTSTTVGTLSANKTYYWRVCGVNATGASSWPVVSRTFTTVASAKVIGETVRSSALHNGPYAVYNIRGQRMVLADASLKRSKTALTGIFLVAGENQRSVAKLIVK